MLKTRSQEFPNQRRVDNKDAVQDALEQKENNHIKPNFASWSFLRIALFPSWYHKH